LAAAHGVLEAQLTRRRWLAGDAFTMADCAAAPALFYSWVVHRWDVHTRPALARYYRELMARPSVDIEDARAFRDVFPLPWPDDADAHRRSGSQRS
jgi:glutathione S-transferase